MLTADIPWECMIARVNSRLDGVLGHVAANGSHVDTGDECLAEGATIQMMGALNFILPENAQVLAGEATTVRVRAVSLAWQNNAVWVDKLEILLDLSQHISACRVFVSKELTLAGAARMKASQWELSRTESSLRTHSRQRSHSIQPDHVQT
jgi:hypothetical protein